VARALAQRLVFVIGLVGLVAPLAAGCGPVGYLTIVTRDANRALVEARTAGAPRAAPYEWTAAMLYLERSHELAGYARWQESLALARRASALARAATQLARRGGSVQR
jgi:hypothetical protein